jgi:hypothetical protein
MDFFELLAKGRHTPVLCVDGAVGMLVEYPLRDAPGDLAGIEVPGETCLRWVAQHELQCAGGALRQSGSPAHPYNVDAADGSADMVMARSLLRELWHCLLAQGHRGSAGPRRWGSGNRA